MSVQIGQPKETSVEGSTFTEGTFRIGNVITITSSHFLNDLYSAFLAPILPLLIEKLSLSYTQAGSLTAFMQFPSLLNPLIGYLDDKINLRCHRNHDELPWISSQLCHPILAIADHRS
jgi:hypothetical protein